ncbi:NUDIX domain-containing protein [Streptomyces sp. NPDC006512]|uniref:NUDIX hydrolase n=1 Tax=Streptomyces sp. NPDC006512 TaxID=3154307 RepID=UPI0033A99476
MTDHTVQPAPFSRIKIRTGALVFCGDDVALVRRDRAHATHYTPPGGNVEDGEDLVAALRRELAELPIFPPIGPALAALPHPRATVTDASLGAVTDADYTWV